MSDETKVLNEVKDECACKCEFCKCIKKILAIAIGTFVGFYCALSLFFALHRPPMPPCGGFHRPPQGFEQNFEHKKMKKFDKQMPQKPQEHDD